MSGGLIYKVGMAVREPKPIDILSDVGTLSSSSSSSESLNIEGQF